MEFNISCKYQKGFSWTHAEGVYFIGFLYNSNNEYLTGKEAINQFKPVQTCEELKRKLKSCNGVFSLIISIGNKLFAYSDKSRFFPLFYLNNKQKLFLSDNFYELLDSNSNLSFDNVAVNQFLSGAITLGSLTVIKGIQQIQSAELVEFENDHISSHLLSSVLNAGKNYQYSEEESIDQFNLAADRLCKSLQNKQVVLPLSGGYDSRLIACWLKQHKIENVICFTYGRKDTSDIQISKQVAQALGYEWHYIEHTPELVADFQKDNEFSEYFKNMSRGTSMFYMQEYFAVRELCRRNIIQPGFVAIPGHSGDMLGGSQFYKVIPPKNKINNLAEKAFNSSFAYMNLKRKDKQTIKDQVKQQLYFLETSLDIQSDYKLYEEWLVRERIAKYVFNSAHVFTHFGGEVRFPFWDDELYSYWFNMPIEKRLYKSYFDQILCKNWFEPMDVIFKKELQASYLDLTIQKIKKLIRPYIPATYKQKLLKKNDWTLYDDITTQFLPELDEMGIKVKHNNKSYINRILHWYLAQLQKDFGLKPFN